MWVFKELESVIMIDPYEESKTKKSFEPQNSLKLQS